MNRIQRNRDRALVFMARAPRAGEVKTRLCPPLTAEEAAAFYSCLLDDLFGAFVSSDLWDSWISHTAESDAYFRQHAGGGFRLLPQQVASLGMRMHAIFDDLFSVGYRSVVVVGSDIPGLEPAVVERTFRLLETERSQIVLGPAEDGGYYLIGLQAPMVRLFEHIPWSTERVLEQTRQRASELGIGITTVQACYDVDVARDLERLWFDLQGSQALRHNLPKTYGWLLRRYAADQPQ